MLSANQHAEILHVYYDMNSKTPLCFSMCPVRVLCLLSTYTNYTSERNNASIRIKSFSSSDFSCVLISADAFFLGFLYVQFILLLTEFEVRTVSVFSQAKRVGHKSERKKRGSLTYSTDLENEVSKIFIMSLAFCMATKTNF